MSVHVCSFLLMISADIRVKYSIRGFSSAAILSLDLYKASDKS